MRLGLTLLLVATNAFSQAIYDANGQYKGNSQTSPSGVTNIYNANGQNVQSFQTDNGQTNFYSPQGQYQGSSTAPLTATPFRCHWYTGVGIPPATTPTITDPPANTYLPTGCIVITGALPVPSTAT